MMTVSYARQSGILDPALAASSHITICGLGTVGSNAMTQLAKLGCTDFTLIDFDTVEAHNVPSQDFEASYVGRLKADACAERVRAVNPDARVRVVTDPLVGYECFVDGIVVLAVDSIGLRRKLFETSVRHRLHTLCVDVRMNANNLQMWSFDPSDDVMVDRYRGTLHDPSQNVSAPCGGRTFAPVGAISGGMVAQMAAKSMRGEVPPFYTFFDMDSMTLAATVEAA